MARADTPAGAGRSTSANRAESGHAAGVDPGEVVVFERFLDDVTASEEEGCLAVLDGAEAAQHARFTHAPSRTAYAVAHALLRRALSALAPVAPGAWRFVEGPHGRPELHPSCGRALSFNLTHTHGYVACAVSGSPEVGVDAERLRERPSLLGVAERFFSRAEVEGLAALPEPDRLRHFFTTWTLKEAYLKARGVGLSLPLAGFSALPDAADGATLAFAEGFPDAEAGAWRFWRWAPRTDVVAAVAVRRAGPGAVRVRREVLAVR